MKRLSREINIFSMSALDLFASAMGAFILLFIITMIDNDSAKDLREKNQQLSQQNTQIQQQLEACQSRSNQLEASLKKCEEEKQALQEKVDQLESQLNQQQQQVENLQSQLDDVVKFALLGINTSAESFTLVIDMSGSMKSYANLMLTTVKRILEPFEEKHKAQIIGFHQADTIVNWQTPYEIVSMNDANKQAAIQFTQGLTDKFEGKTPTLKALKQALKYDSKAIILLTDGSATDASANQIINTITSMNGGAKEIHTVAIGDYHKKAELTAFLQVLAKKNGGVFVGVAH